MSLRVRLHGDTDIGKEVLPAGKKFLVWLKKDMEYNDLKQNQRTHKMADGIIFKVGSVFGQDTIDVTVPEKVVVEEEVKERFVVKPYYVVVCIGETENEPEWCLIWDAVNNCEASFFPSYPVAYSDYINSFGKLLTNVVSQDIFDKVLAGEFSLYRGSGSAVSANDGCEELINEYTDDGTTNICHYQVQGCGSWPPVCINEDCYICAECSEMVEDGCPESGDIYMSAYNEDYEFGVMQAWRSGIPTSYNLTIITPEVDELPILGAGETSCVRTKTDWESGNFSWYYYPQACWPQVFSGWEDIES